MSEQMNEFLDKVDALCFEYGYEIHPKIDGQYETITIIGNDEICEVTCIDGDGRGR
jgi:hypothetical protein